MYVFGKLTLEQFIQGVKNRNPGEVEFHQAVEEVLFVKSQRDMIELTSWKTCSIIMESR